MLNFAVIEKELPYMNLSDSQVRRRFERFLIDVVSETYGKYLSGVLNVNYAGAPGILFYIDDDRGPLLELLVLYLPGSVKYRISLLRPFAAREAVSRAARLIESALRFFAETGGIGVAYFVFVPGRQIIPPRTESKFRRSVQSLFLSNLVFLFAISILISYAVYAVFGRYAPIAIVLMQLPLVVASYRLVPIMMGDWMIDKKHRYVYLIGIHMPIEKYQKVVRQILLPKRFEIKKKLYVNSLLKGEEPEINVIQDVLSEYGLHPNDYEIEIRRVDLYGIVERVVKMFKTDKIPRIYLSNIVIPNAAASGIGLSLSSIVITTGLISRLDDEEIEAVIGHEISHLKRHDVLTFFLLSNVEYLTRVYLALLLWPLFATPLGLLYLWISITALFVVAKFVEARADIDAARYIGKPEKLSSALRKIGIKHIFLESNVSGRLMAWLRWDPHPPITYRIEKLKELETGYYAENAWREAIWGCLKDLIRTLRLALV